MQIDSLRKLGQIKVKMHRKAIQVASKEDNHKHMIKFSNFLYGIAGEKNKKIKKLFEKVDN
jgi:hypothetical protein